MNTETQLFTIEHMRQCWNYAGDFFNENRESKDDCLKKPFDEFIQSIPTPTADTTVEGVEDAAVSYIRKTYSNYIMPHLLIDIFKAGANWQASRQKTIEKSHAELLAALKDLLLWGKTKDGKLTMTTSLERKSEIETAIANAEKLQL